MVEDPLMNERENILGRIREALRFPAPSPGTHHGEPPCAASPPASDSRRLLPASGDSFEDNLALFQKNSIELRADFFLLKDAAELGLRLNQLRDAEGWKKVGTHSGALTDIATRELGLPLCLTDQAYESRELASCDAGISECDALVAHTGSVLVTSRSAGGRALSVLPPHHVVLARRDQLLGGLPDAFALVRKKYAPNYPSLISFITGPSRTGDIERILVLGAHGPRKLTIFCV